MAASYFFLLFWLFLPSLHTEPLLSLRVLKRRPHNYLEADPTIHEKYLSSKLSTSFPHPHNTCWGAVLSLIRSGRDVDRIKVTIMKSLIADVNQCR